MEEHPLLLCELHGVEAAKLNVLADGQEYGITVILAH